MNARRWQDWVMLALGAWLFFSPFWMAGYASTMSAAAWNSYLSGAAVAVFALIALASPARWEEWIEAVLGVWLVVSPFFIAFRGHEFGGGWNEILVGVLVLIDAFWAMSIARRQVPAAR